MRWFVVVALLTLATPAVAQTSTTATVAPKRVTRPTRPSPPKRAKKRRRTKPPPRDAGTRVEAPQREPAAVAPPPTVEAPPPPIVDRIRSVPNIEILRQLGDPWVLLVMILLVLVAVRMSTVISRRLLPEGFLPRTNQLARTALRLVLVALILWLVVTLAPAWMGPALPWILLTILAIGLWSARDILPDVVAGLVLRIERRIGVGAWVHGDGFSGVVRRIGTRGVTLRDVSDRYVEVPNRLLLGAPVIRVQGTWTAHDACVTIDAQVPAAVIRRALADAVLTSPWIPLEPHVVVRRDGTRPDRWWVRTRLLDARYADRFEGELLERAQAIIDGCKPAADPL